MPWRSKEDGRCSARGGWGRSVIVAFWAVAVVPASMAAAAKNRRMYAPDLGCGADGAREELSSTPCMALGVAHEHPFRPPRRPPPAACHPGSRRLRHPADRRAYE